MNTMQFFPPKPFTKDSFALMLALTDWRCLLRIRHAVLRDTSKEYARLLERHEDEITRPVQA